SAEPRGPYRNSRIAWRGSQHAAQPRLGGSLSMGLRRRAAHRDRAVPSGLRGRPGAAAPDRAHLRERGAHRVPGDAARCRARARAALLLRPRGRWREAFTASLVAANAFYLSLASDAADEARKNIPTVEQPSPVMIDLAQNSLQRAALSALAQRAAAFGDGLKTLAEQFSMRTNLLKTAIDDNQAAMIAVINKLSAQMTLRELQAQGSFDHTLANIYQNVALVAVIFLTLIVVIGALIARSIILPLKEIMAAMHGVVSEKYDEPIQGTHARDEIGEMA